MSNYGKWKFGAEMFGFGGEGGGMLGVFYFVLFL